jgi:hypothetical protein
MSDLLQTSHIIFVLTKNPDLDAQTLFKTISNVFLQVTNAVFYLYKHNEFYENMQEVEFPQGIFSEE